MTKKHIQQLTAAQFDKAFPDEEACCVYLVGKRWPKGVKCARCGAEKPAELSSNPWHWQCYKCGKPTSYRFSHITGTIFENTNKPLRDWFKVIHLMLTTNKGISALQIMRDMGFGSYKTAWYMCHRVRAALAGGELEKLGGIVEVDETFVGGKFKSKHWDKRGGSDPDAPPGCTPGGHYRTGAAASGKIPVGRAVQRKGKVVARVLENVRADKQR
jgi:Transposase zinc-ribbon domain